MLAQPAPPDGGAAPPGVDPQRLVTAMLEDVCEVLSGLADVAYALALSPPGWLADAEGLLWPGTPVLQVASRETGDQARAVLEMLRGLGADEGMAVAPDAPDVPPLLLAKLYSGLAGTEVAACPAEGGGLVALACRLPVPSWLAAARVGLDTADAVERLRAAAPRRGLLVGPGWRRLRRPTDIGRLDPGLEGWDATRLLTAGVPREQR